MEMFLAFCDSSLGIAIGGTLFIMGLSMGIGHIMEIYYRHNYDERINQMIDNNMWTTYKEKVEYK